MMVGIASGWRVYEQAAIAGADYFECAVSGTEALTEAEYADILRRVQQVGLSVRCGNGLLKGTMRLTGKEPTSAQELTDYLNSAFSRIRRLGVKTAVFGSGAARCVPEGFDASAAHQQLLEAGNLIGDKAREFGILIAVEPLNREETNVLNSVADGAAFVRELNHPAVHLLADSFHMLAEKEPFSTLPAYREELIHAHISEGIFGKTELRVAPNRADENGVKDFVKALVGMGYAGGISIEAGIRGKEWTEEMTEAVAAIRSWMK